jgi:uncharacterized protein (DUF849 family)
VSNAKSITCAVSGAGDTTGSSHQVPTVAQAILLGGNRHVGLEDNIYLERGLLASNGMPVKPAVEVIERLGARVPGPETAGAKIGLV